MASGRWESSTRRKSLPGDWAKIRRRILARDQHRCTWVQDGRRCSNRATDVDHRSPGGDHRDSNLRSLCEYHHRGKSASEGGRAYAEQIKKAKSMFRRTERHPGEL